MGLRDRDYYQEDYTITDIKLRRRSRSNGWSITVILIAINAALWLANGLLSLDLTGLLMLREEYVKNLSSCYRFLTYGFVHSPNDVWHIVFNMFGLVMFGYGMMLGIGPGGFGFVRGENVETRLGRQEFLAFYLLTIIIGGIVFALINLDTPKAGCLGASGGVCGVIILYAWMYPNKTLLLWGILPMPMWGIGLLLVFMDAMGASGSFGEAKIAFSVHLAGAAFGTLYYLLFFKQGIKLTGRLGSSYRPKRKPKVRIHTPDEPTSPTSEEDEFNRRLDNILKRYGEVGEAGLTPEEREFLQRASRIFAEKNRKP